MFSMGRKLGRKGGARPHPHQHHPVPQGPPFSIHHTLATGSPPEVQKQSHKKRAALTTPKRTQCAFAKIPPHPHTWRLTSLPAWVEQLRLLRNLHHPHRCRPFSRPGGHTIPTVSSDRQGLTFDLLARPPQHLSKGQRSHMTGDTPTSPNVASARPTGRAQPCNITPNRKHKKPQECTHTNCTQALGHAHKLN